MASETELALWMIDQVHLNRRRTRRELIEGLNATFGDVEALSPRVLKRFRTLHVGEIRYSAAGAYWESLRRAPGDDAERLDFSRVAKD